MAESLLHAALHKLPSRIIPEGAQGVNSALFYLMEVYMIDDKKVIEALHIIQNICASSECSINCPFGDSVGICMLHEHDPVYWHINDNPVIWRALV